MGVPHVQDEGVCVGWFDIVEEGDDFFHEFAAQVGRPAASLCAVGGTQIPGAEEAEPSYLFADGRQGEGVEVLFGGVGEWEEEEGDGGGEGGGGGVLGEGGEEGGDGDGGEGR